MGTTTTAQGTCTTTVGHAMQNTRGLHGMQAPPHHHHSAAQGAVVLQCHRAQRAPPPTTLGAAMTTHAPPTTAPRHAPPCPPPRCVVSPPPRTTTTVHRHHHRPPPWPPRHTMTSPTRHGARDAVKMKHPARDMARVCEGVGSRPQNWPHVHFAGSLFLLPVHRGFHPLQNPWLLHGIICTLLQMARAWEYGMLLSARSCIRPASPSATAPPARRA